MKANPELIPGLVEEAIRWMTPVKHFMRSATVDTELGTRSIARGDWLMLCYASANRDDAVFDEPYQFRSDRKPNRHLAFGYGAHLCIGQYLARMEMRILFEELLLRLKSLSLDGEPKMTQATFQRTQAAADPLRRRDTIARRIAIVPAQDGPERSRRSAGAGRVLRPRSLFLFLAGPADALDG